MGIPHLTSQIISSRKSHQDKMKTFLTLALFSTLLAFSNASFWEAGPCPPKPEVVTPFEVEGYLGDWYTQWETPMPYGTSENTCTRSQYGSLPQGVNIISTYPVTGLGDVCGWIQPAQPLNPTGDLNLYMGTEPSPGWILDTDYETYAATYSCEENPLDLTHFKNAAITTRDPFASRETIDKALEAFERNGLEINDWYPIVHTEDCVYDRDPDVRTCQDRWEE